MQDGLEGERTSEVVEWALQRAACDARFFGAVSPVSDMVATA